ncbi:MAG: XRE family transcriptional regulator [Pedobacter sp.]|nr:MAG: XRE family transcriptional regulator [Pedobacter sp.]
MEEQLAQKAKNVASNIRKLREFRDYTQDYLASKLNISQNAYSKLELGYCKISLERLYAIADILQVDPVHILTLEHTELIKIDLPNQNL